MSIFGFSFGNKSTGFSDESGISAINNSSSIVFKAIYSNSWENIDQNFYTKLAQSIDPIDSTLTFFAEILASGVIKAKNKAGDDVSDTDPLVQLLKNPNENQNQAEFIKEWLYYFLSHGWTYVVPKSSAVGFEFRLGGSTKTQIYNTDPDNIVWGTFWDLFMNFLGLGNRDKIKFSYKPLGFVNVLYTDVIPFIDVRQNPERPYVGISRLLALKQNIQNYALSLQAKENMIRRSGSQMISPAVPGDDLGLDSAVGSGKFDANNDPIMTTHKEKLEQQLRETGIGSRSMGVIFSTLPLRAQSLSEGLEKIDYDKLGIQDARVIMNKFNLPKEFQNLTLESPKFLNRDAAMLEVVQNTVTPWGNLFCNKMQVAFKSENTLWMDFSHLPIFAEKQSTQTETQQKVVDLYNSLKEKGYMSDEEVKAKLKEHGII